MPRQGLKGDKPEGLSKRERVLRAFAGAEVDRRPFTFWHPFGLSHMKADSLTAAGITFAAVYGVDLLRMPTVKDLPLPAQSSLDRPHDLTTIEPLTPRSGFWSERIEAFKSMVKLADRKIAIFESVADPLTALSWLCPPEMMVSAERSHPTFLDKALATVAEGYRGYLRALLTEAKIDGVVIEVGSATFEDREPEDFSSLVKPHLLSMLEEIRSLGDAPIWLQATGKRVYLNPLLDLPHDMLSWSHLQHGPSLEKLPRGHKGGLAGGLNEKLLERASYQDLRRLVEDARNMPVRLLCPGDALPADIAPSKLEGLSNFLGKRDRIPETSPAGARPEPIIDEP